MPKAKIITKKHLARLEKERIQKRNLLIGILIVGVLIIGVIVYGILDVQVFQLNRAVAQVGDRSISVREFQNQVRFDRWQLIRQYQQTLQTAQMFGSDQSFAQYFTQQLQEIEARLTNSASAGSTGVDELIQNAVVEREAKKRGITVTDQEVEEALQNAFGYYANPTATPTVTPKPVFTSTFSPTQLALVTLTPTATSEPTLTPTPATITATPTVVSTPTQIPTITPTPTPYTIEGYRGEVKKLTDELVGAKLTENELRIVLKANLYSKKLFEAMSADVKPEQEQVWARHILVADEAQANDVLKRLKAGGDFATLAAELSTDESNKAQGGDLGWFGRGKMVTEFDQAAFALKIGEISQPVKTTFGYHIIQVLGHEIRTLSPEELETTKQEIFQKWLTEAKAAKDIQKFEDAWKDRIPVEPTVPPGLTG